MCNIQKNQKVCVTNDEGVGSIEIQHPHKYEESRSDTRITHTHTAHRVLEKMDDTNETSVRTNTQREHKLSEAAVRKRILTVPTHRFRRLGRDKKKRREIESEKLSVESGP